MMNNSNHFSVQGTRSTAVFRFKSRMPSGARLSGVRIFRISPLVPPHQMETGLRRCGPALPVRALHPALFSMAKPRQAQARTPRTFDLCGRTAARTASAQLRLAGNRRGAGVGERAHIVVGELDFLQARRLRVGSELMSAQTRALLNADAVL